MLDSELHERVQVRNMGEEGLQRTSLCGVVA